MPESRAEVATILIYRFAGLLWQSDKRFAQVNGFRGNLFETSQFSLTHAGGEGGDFTGTGLCHDAAGKFGFIKAIKVAPMGFQAGFQFCVINQLRFFLKSVPVDFSQKCGSSPRVSNQGKGFALSCCGGTGSPGVGKQKVEILDAFDDLDIRSVFTRFRSFWRRFRVDLVSIWYRFGVDLVSIWCRFGVHLVSIWYRFGVDLVLIWCRFGASLVSLWCTYGVLLVQIWCRVGDVLVPFRCRFGVKLVPIWYRFGFELVSIWCQFGLDLILI